LSFGPSSTAPALLQLCWILLACLGGKWSLFLPRWAGFRHVHVQECRLCTLTVFCAILIAFSSSVQVCCAAALFLWSIPWTWLWGPAAGIAFLCRDPASGRAYILVGQERMHGHAWYFPYGKAAGTNHGNHHRTAVREACEETCYALGLPDNIYSKYFRGKQLPQFGGAYLVDLGFMTETERNSVISCHLDNRNGNRLKKVKGRRPTGCEREMIQLKWCDGESFLKHAGGSIPGFGHFRGFCANIMRKMASSHSFSQWCKQSNSGTSSSSTSRHPQAPSTASVSSRCPKGHKLVDYITRGNNCKACRGHFEKGTHVMNCKRCSWWLCSACYKGTAQGSADETAEDGQVLVAATPSHGSAGEEQVLQECNDEEYQMFVRALCASLADTGEFSVSNEEDEMLAIALSASLADEQETSKRRKV